MVDEPWIDTEDLIERSPAPRATLTRLARMEFAGNRELPAEIPLSHAVILAAVAQAHVRGVVRPKRVFSLLMANKDAIDDHLVVIARSGTPELVPVEGFTPVPATVLDLPELRDQVLSGQPIAG